MLRALGLACMVFSACVQAALARDLSAQAEPSALVSGNAADLREIHVAQTNGAASPSSTAPTAAASAPNPLPTLAELEAAGAVIGEIRINTQNIFDPDDPRERCAQLIGSRTGSRPYTDVRPGPSARYLPLSVSDRGRTR